MIEVITTMTDEEMVDWANANLERVRELEAEFALAEKFGWRPDAMGLEIKRLQAEVERLREALRDVHEFCTCDAHIIANAALAEKDDE